MTITARTRVAVLSGALWCLAVGQPILGAQDGTSIQGTLIDSLTDAPIPAATVILEELDREVVAGLDGAFTFEDVPPGTYHLSVRAEGFSSRRTEIEVALSPVTIRVQVDVDLHFQEVMSVSPGSRSQFESYQPTTVLSGQALAQQLEISLGTTLERQPGVASRGVGPAASRPVIRGLDGDRVLILQDGQRVGDLSSQSGDHGVAVNPAAAQRIEVVRGPATLLYGANAIGGLVNVITDEIPTEPQEGVNGDVTVDLGSAASEAGTAADLHVGNGTLALHVGGGGRRSSDVSTPEGDIENSQSRSAFANAGLSWTGARGYFGGSYGYDDTRYGIPVVEEGSLQLTPRRHAINLRSGLEDVGPFSNLRATVGLRRYEHTEFKGDEVGTIFRNDTNEFELMATHRAIRRLTGSAGAWALDRAFDAEGAEALAPPIDQTGIAAFFYEELSWPHLTLQFGGRVDRVSFEPVGEPERDFTNGSGSIGLLITPPTARDSVTVAVSVARAARNPALEELFFFGEHHGNFAIEVGNPGLASERALGFDASLRWRSSRISGEATYFRNDISDFIFRNVIPEDEFLAREEEFAARFPGRPFAGHAHEGESGEGEHGDELAFVEFVGADALLQGIEAHADVQITAGIAAELGVDYVRGTLRRSGDPLQRMPPLRFRGGLAYRKNAFQVGGELLAAADQKRVGGVEEPTEGYRLLRLFSSYSFTSGETMHTITLRLDNVTNQLYRNHLSLIKEVVPEVGRNVKALYSVNF